MNLPDYQAFMLPLLQEIVDGHEHHIRDVTARLADRFQLTAEQRDMLLPSGQQSVLANRVAWAKTYLKKAGLLENPKRGVIRISAIGRKKLEQEPAHIDSRSLLQNPTFAEFYRGRSRSADAVPDVIASETNERTPDELMEESHLSLREKLADDLIDRIKSCSPRFFERLVVELLVAMGYGGTLEDAGQAVGRSGDNGIDGIIKEDKLGLDLVVIQAKRWEQNVGRPEVQAFAGSMEGLRARKGVFITTSGFTRDAIDFVQRIERKIVLVDGGQLSQLMIDHGVGVSVARTFVIKRVDSDYFTESDDAE